MLHSAPCVVVPHLSFRLELSDLLLQLQLTISASKQVLQ